MTFKIDKYRVYNLFVTVAAFGTVLSTIVALAVQDWLKVCIPMFLYLLCAVSVGCFQHDDV